MHFADAKGMLFKKSSGTITEITHCHGDYYAVKVRPEKGFTWVGGEYIALFFPGVKLKGKNWRRLSFASIPSEGEILLAFRTGKVASPYKQHLIDHGLNATVEIRGPVGDFKLRNDTRPVVMFAAGVGIPPIFSILKSVKDDQSRDIHVVYSSSEYHLFKDDIDLIAQANPKIRLEYTNHRDETKAKLTELAKKYGNDAYYYTSGSGSVIKSTRSLLKELGIAKANMLNDHFEGYK